MISAEIMELYQAVILDHNKNPKNYRKIDGATFAGEGFNPLCGDHLHLYIKLDEKKKTITDIAFEGEGCAISKASTSLMTETLKGKTITEAQNIFKEFHNLLTGKLDPANDEHSLGKLKIFAGIWKYPARIKCASLSWHTMNSAIAGESDIVQTE